MAEASDGARRGVSRLWSASRTDRRNCAAETRVGAGHRGARYFKKSRRVLCEGVHVKYAFIRTQESVHRVTRLCRALAVSRSGYYAWRNRGLSARATEDAQLAKLLRRLHEETREQYGAIKLWREAQTRGIACGRHRVARLRKLAGLEARRVRRFRLIVEHHQLPAPAPNLLQQCFVVPRLDRVWVGDMTHVPTRAGWLYVAV